MGPNSIGSSNDPENFELEPRISEVNEELNDYAKLVECYAGPLSQGEGYSEEVYKKLNDFLEGFRKINSDEERKVQVGNFLKEEGKEHLDSEQFYELASALL